MWSWGMMIFPFFGILFMVICLFFMFQMFSRRGSMGGHREDEIDDLRREIKGLKEEIVKLQSGREALKVSKDRKDSTCPQTKD
jgi:cell division protein FtsB